MKRKTIVLADNSYTIRRIVELSFSDEADIELVSFENGLNLREKLFELRPQIVLVDIKLPEFNGYDVCKFIQGNEALKSTKVFLLKGGFEPIDENLLVGLKYENIITKPFDSNALVANIKKLLEKMPVQKPPETTAEAPYSLPEDEDLAEIETLPGPEKEISFSDVKDEIDSDGILVDEDELVPTPGAFPEEEILPSEEITRAQPDKDTISPGLEEEENPFAEEMPLPKRKEAIKEESPDSLTAEELNIRRNIELQEKELEIDSLTLEEINIKRNIERRERVRTPLEPESFPGMAISDEGEEEGAEADTSEMFPERKLESPEAFFPFEGKKAKAVAPLLTEFEPTDDEMFPKVEIEEPEIPEIKYEHAIDEKDTLLDIESQPIEEAFFAKKELPPREKPRETPSTRKMEMPKPPAPPQVEEIAGPEPLQFDIGIKTAREELDFTGGQIPVKPGPKGYKFPELEIPPTPKAKIELEKEIEPERERPMEVPKIPKVPKVPQTVPVTPVSEEKRGRKIPVTPEPTPTMKKKSEMPGVPPQEVLTKVEDKLTLAIKEMLWEIVPPLAEKIIKEEIDTLKSDTEKSLKK